MKQNALVSLQRWEAAGGTWLVREGGSGSTVVDLITCDGGQVMDQLVSSDPDFLAYVQEGPRNRPDR